MVDGELGTSLREVSSRREGPYYANQPARPLDLKPIEHSVLNVKAVVAAQPGYQGLLRDYTTSHFAKIRFQLHWASI